MSNVLVTGGSGFLAGWTIRKLLEQGHTVRATVRTLGKADAVTDMLNHEGVDTTRLTWMVADLNSPDGWDQAMDGIEYVLHTASPLGGEDHNDPSLIPTAREGALNIIDAAIAAGVRKIVMTSSAAAVFPGRASTRQDIDETFWTNLDDPLVTNYMRSKTVAEKVAWERIGAQTQTRLVTILPGAIFGPFMAGRRSSTDLLFTTILNGTPSPKATYNVVDVRDLADLHILAMTDERADGQRFPRSTRRDHHARNGTPHEEPARRERAQDQHHDHPRLRHQDRRQVQLRARRHEHPHRHEAPPRPDQSSTTPRLGSATCRTDRHRRRRVHTRQSGLNLKKPVTAHGVEDSTDSKSGYVIVEADSHGDAVQMFAEHPHLQLHPGNSIEVLECPAMAGRER